MDQLIEFVGNHLPLSVTFLALLVLLIVTEVRRRGQGFNELSPIEATQVMNRRPTVMLDVREDREYQEGHIVNAIHIPLSKLNERAKELQKHKNKAIIAYCRTGNRSASASARLHKQGFETVYNLRGGISAWQRENLPLSRK